MRAKPTPCCALANATLKAPSHFGVQIRAETLQTQERAPMPIYEPWMARTASPDGENQPAGIFDRKRRDRLYPPSQLTPHPLFRSANLSIVLPPLHNAVSPKAKMRAQASCEPRKNECGIHMVDGKWQPLRDEKRRWKRFYVSKGRHAYIERLGRFNLVVMCWVSMGMPT